MIIGVLALQGDYQAHIETLRACGVEHVRLVRDAQSLAACDGLVIPGGESTTMSRLCERYDLWPALEARRDAGMAFFGTCAGMIFLAKDISGATRNFTQKTLNALDIDVQRNAYGAQDESFEAELYSSLEELEGAPLRAIFIRAPRLSRIGDDVEILASHREDAVAVRHKNVMALSWHPEIVGETRWHKLWLRDLNNSPGHAS